MDGDGADTTSNAANLDKEDEASITTDGSSEEELDYDTSSSEDITTIHV